MFMLKNLYIYKFKKSPPAIFQQEYTHFSLMGDLKDKESRDLSAHSLAELYSLKSGKS